MDFSFTEEQIAFRNAIRRFAEQEIAPLVEEAEEKEKFPLPLFRKMGELGYLCVGYPEEYGGAGVDKITECIYMEELNRISAGISSAIMVQGGLATNPIYTFGTEEQKQKYLVPAIKGEKIGAFALTEPDAGSDAASIKTRAQREGNDYVINGSKTFITNAPICDYAIVVAYTDPSKRGEGINLFIVDDGTPGFVKGRKLSKVGNRSQETGELFFEDCRVHKSQMIGDKEGGGFAQLEHDLMIGRMIYAARSIGVAVAAYEATVKYAQERKQFGSPIGKFQAIRFRIAEMAMLIEVMRSYTYKVAWLLDQGEKCMREASMAKLFCTETVQKIVADAMQIHGGYGYMMEYPIQRYWRDARLYTITEGTSEIQHLIISRDPGI